MKTPVCDLLGIDVPIFAFSHCRDVVIEVSKAGGFGVLGATAFTPAQLDVELGLIEEALAGRPYGVDVLLPVRYVGRDEGGLTRDRLRERIPDEHRRFVEDLLDRYDVPPLPDDRADERRRPDLAPGADDAEGQASLVDVSFAHGISLFASALGPPPPDIVERSHAQGVVVAALAGTPCTRSVTWRRASTSSWRRATRRAATPVRSARWCSCPRSSMRSRPLRCSRRAGSPTAARWRPRSRSARRVCGRARCGSRPRRPRPTPR